MPAYVAVDKGAESGRVVAGVYDGERSDVRDMHRFADRPLRAGEDLTWDSDSLYDETVRGLRSAAKQVAGVRSVGLDCCGSDCTLAGVLLLKVIQNLINRVGTLSYRQVVSGVFLLLVVLIQTWLSCARPGVSLHQDGEDQ